MAIKGRWKKDIKITLVRRISKVKKGSDEDSGSKKISKKELLAEGGFTEAAMDFLKDANVGNAEEGILSLSWSPFLYCVMATVSSRLFARLRGELSWACFPLSCSSIQRRELSTRVSSPPRERKAVDRQPQ